MRPPFIPPSVRPAPPVESPRDENEQSFEDSIPSDWANTETSAGFDWQAAASLARSPDDAERANEEWNLTDWDNVSSDSNHAASTLAQIVRQIRSGSLHVDLAPNASAEATLAAILAALLAERAPRQSPAQV